MVETSTVVVGVAAVRPSPVAIALNSAVTAALVTAPKVVVVSVGAVTGCGLVNGQAGVGSRPGNVDGIRLNTLTIAQFHGLGGRRHGEVIGRGERFESRLDRAGAPG